MLKKMKNLLKINKDSVEIKPVLDGNYIRVSYFINGVETDWNLLSAKEQEKYSKLIDEKYGKGKIPLEKFTPGVAAKESIEDYANCDPEWLLKALRDWEECPESHPLLEEWYQAGCPNIPRRKTKEELEFEAYYPVFEKARELKNSDIVSAVEKYAFILNNYKPIGSLYYTEPADLFCSLCRYDEAMFCIGLAKENIGSIHDDEQNSVVYEFIEFMKNIELQRNIFNEVMSLVKNNQGAIQSEIYKGMSYEPTKIRMVILNMSNTGFLKREKYKTSYKLYSTDKEISKDYLVGF